MENNDMALPASQDRAIVNGAASVSALRASVPSAEDVLRSIAAYVGAGGFNAEHVDPREFERKIRWGIDYLTDATFQRAADIVEECSKRPGTTWGEVKAAIIAHKGSRE